MKRRLAFVGVFAAGAVGAALLMVGGVRFLNGLENSYHSAWSVIAAEVLRLAIPVAGGIGAIRWFRLRSARSETHSPRCAPVASRAKRTAYAVVLAGYAFTWIAGVPAVLSVLTTEEIEEFKRLEARTHAPSWQQFPRIRTTIALPVVPGVILLYHEAQLAGLNGWGGWVIYGWWGGGSSRIATIWRWIS